MSSYKQLYEETTGQRRCARCGKVKPLDQFSASSKSWCRPCRAEYDTARTRARRGANRKAYNAYMREYRRQRKEREEAQLK